MPLGQQAINDLAQRHGFSPDAVLCMLESMVNGNGGMAQFNHPEFGGSGQWMRGGMIMVSDMFNHYLKGRIEGLCNELSGLVANQPDLISSGSFQSQTQGNQQQGKYGSGQKQNGSAPVGPVSLFVPPAAGGSGNWWRQIQYILPIIPRRDDVSRIYGLSCVILNSGVLFLCDTYMVIDPTAEQIAEMTLLAAEAVRGFGTTPKAALLSHSSFGASDSESARKMRRALGLIRERAPTLEIDGEMHADAALVQSIRDRAVGDSRLSGTANLLIMPNLDAANIAFNLLQAAADGLAIGPLLLGMTKPIHVVVPSVTARGIVNLSALAVVEAGRERDNTKRYS